MGWGYKFSFRLDEFEAPVSGGGAVCLAGMVGVESEIVGRVGDQQN